MYEPILRRLVGDEYTLTGSEAQLACPVHEQRTGKPDTRPSFYFNIESGLCYCFSCHFRGNHESLWAAIKGGTAPTVIEPMPIDEGVAELRRRMARLDAPPLPTVISEEDLHAFEYPTLAMLHSRGISVPAAEMLEIRAQEGAWILPIRHFVSGVLMGFQIKQDQYVRNLPRGVAKGLSLFGMAPHIEFHPGKPVVVVESPLDVAVCRTHDVQAVAVYGSHPTADQMHHLAQFSELVLAFDNDESGRRATDIVSDYLIKRVVPFRTVAWPTGAKDPGDVLGAIVDLVHSAEGVLSQRLGQ